MSVLVAVSVHCVYDVAHKVVLSRRVAASFGGDLASGRQRGLFPGARFTDTGAVHAVVVHQVCDQVNQHLLIQPRHSD